MKKRGNEGGRRAGRGEGEDKGGKEKARSHSISYVKCHSICFGC